MNLLEGLKIYQAQSATFNLFTNKVEELAVGVLFLLEKYKKEPEEEALGKVKQFLIED